MGWREDRWEGEVRWKGEEPRGLEDPEGEVGLEAGLGPVEGLDLGEEIEPQGARWGQKVLRERVGFQQSEKAGHAACEPGDLMNGQHPPEWCSEAREHLEQCSSAS